MEQPNPIKVALGIIRVLLTVRKPNPTGPSSFDHSLLAPVLDGVAKRGIPGAKQRIDDLETYLGAVALVDPDHLTRPDALAFWINVYNAGAIRLAVEAWDQGLSSVLRVPGAFSTNIIEIAGEDLSLDAIEHAKLRRFGEPRIHGALVCGSLSCPTLSASPFDGDTIDQHLESQMRMFMAGGGATKNDDVLALSRIFLWFGGDFVRPHRMPTFIPASKSDVAEAVSRWMPDNVSGYSGIEYQDYDWGLACKVA